MQQDAPYESPLEVDFVYHLEKYLHPDRALIPQYEVATQCGFFRVDFVAHAADGRRIGLECDGRDFHDDYRDEWRDAVILGEGHLQRMVRMRGTDLYRAMEDVLYLLSRLEPSIFSERGRTNLESLASYVAREQAAIDETSLTLHYPNSEESPQLGIVFMEYRSNPPVHGREFWQALYRRVCEAGGGDLDSLIARYRRERNATAYQVRF